MALTLKTSDVCRKKNGYVLLLICDPRQFRMARGSDLLSAQTNVSALWEIVCSFYFLTIFHALHKVKINDKFGLPSHWSNSFLMLRQSDPAQEGSVSQVWWHWPWSREVGAQIPRVKKPCHRWRCYGDLKCQGKGWSVIHREQQEL